MNNIEGNLNLDKSLLILDDDDVFRNRLITAMKRKGYEAYGVASVKEAKSSLSEKFPKYAVVDLRLDDGNGLEIVSLLSQSALDKAKMIENRTNTPVALWDERLSTVGAFKISSQLDINVTKRVQKIDENAATFILQGAIEFLNN